jgi:hypothetical protein
MMPKEVHKIRFLELNPEFFEPYVKSRVEEALREAERSEEYRFYGGETSRLGLKLMEPACERRQEMFAEYENAFVAQEVEENRCCYLRGLCDGLEYASAD